MKYLILLLFLVGCENKHPGIYEIGECFYHINAGWNYRIDKVAAKIKVENEYLYISKSLNVLYGYDHVAYDSFPVSYYDKTHYKKSHEQKCNEATNKSNLEECLKNPRYAFTNGGLKKCPKNKEELDEIIKNLPDWKD